MLQSCLSYYIEFYKYLLEKKNNQVNIHIVSKLSIIFYSVPRAPKIFGPTLGIDIELYPYTALLILSIYSPINYVHGKHLQITTRALSIYSSIKSLLGKHLQIPIKVLLLLLLFFKENSFFVSP